MQIFSWNFFYCSLSFTFFHGRLKSFRRWMSETCLPCPPTKLDNNELYVFSFYEDIVQVNIFLFGLWFSFCVHSHCPCHAMIISKNLGRLVIFHLGEMFIVASFSTFWHGSRIIDFSLFRDTRNARRFGQVLNSIKMEFCAFRKWKWSFLKRIIGIRNS